ncbi:hypothetical protein [Mucilaginibacter jinjuensis]|uniref:DUF4397 domain-containing protein n=1 Tax=Mucilaginibacter jinjuensis TaxID=1176721 RepID=A0ABY7TAQ5_9SPHI|nr:hypothetical protein [Mucilaginibacter jinjuensis]WCT13590.1 hypothetical protein PQO05_06535 [Mucilaginibacter jinjuensis]
MKFKSIIILLTVAGIYGCGKASDAPIATAPATVLNIINTTADTLNYYLNGTRLNSQSAIYSGGSSGYLSVQSTLQNYQFRKNGHNEVLFNLPLNLDTIHTKYADTVSIKNANGSTTLITSRIRGYSLFVNGEGADKSFLKLDTIKVNTDSSMVRFVHSAVNAPALDLSIGDINFKNQTYGSMSKFKSQVAGANKIINVYLAGGTDVKATQKVTLISNTTYTLYVKGVPDGVGKSALTVGVFVNNQ